jgi:hypothetical protein
MPARSMVFFLLLFFLADAAAWSLLFSFSKRRFVSKFSGQARAGAFLQSGHCLVDAPVSIVERKSEREARKRGSSFF